MCGICGIIDYNTNGSVKKERLQRMTGQLKHRGPDDEGAEVIPGRPSVGLGHRRLSIIDLTSSGHQPMTNEDGTVLIVCNGEIYNYRQLRIQLEDKGHVFKSSTDTEVIIHLYEEHGKECVRYLRGMFAFALWDSREKTLLLARDRVGKKPLLYYHKGNVFCFASEFCSILASGCIPKDINDSVIDSYLSFGYVPSPLTIYKDIFKLSPAHLLILKDNVVKTECYWNLDYSRKRVISERDARDELIRLLEDAVRVRLYSDVPLGAFLSGGIDSSTIVGLMSRLYPGRVKTFTIGFDDKDYSEVVFARSIAKKFGTEHHEFIVKPNALDILPFLVERYGEPYADSSCIPTYYVARETKRFVTVALNGDGGDESFAGYQRYEAMIAADFFQRFPVWLRTLFLKASAMLPDSLDSKNTLRRVKRFMEGASLPFLRRYVKWAGIIEGPLKCYLYSDSYINSLCGGSVDEVFDPFMDVSSEVGKLDKLLNTDVHRYLPDDLLVKMDITSMANALEARSPFLDHTVMEFAASLPVSYKLRLRNKKYILKKAIEDFIPKENIYRAKMGFGVPVGRWFRAELKDFLGSNLLSEKCLNRGYFKPDSLKSLVHDHVEGRRDYTFQLWALLMLELWHQRFID